MTLTVIYHVIYVTVTPRQRWAPRSVSLFNSSVTSNTSPSPCTTVTWQLPRFVFSIISPVILLLLTPCQHYLWASGHFLLLLSSLRYLLAWATLKSVSAWWYKGPFPSPHGLVKTLDIPFCRVTASFTGALISYAIVCQCVAVFLSFGFH